jgi:hypothetical protein
MGKHGDVGLLCGRALAVAAHGAATSEHGGQRNRRNKFCEFHFFPFLFGYRQQGSGSWQPRTLPFSIAAYLTIYRASFIAENNQRNTSTQRPIPQLYLRTIAVMLSPLVWRKVDTADQLVL